MSAHNQVPKTKKNHDSIDIKFFIMDIMIGFTSKSPNYTYINKWLDVFEDIVNVVDGKAERF